jgi:aminoglycoside phosphotransferase (APT) family kinase protein
VSDARAAAVTDVLRAAGALRGAAAVDGVEQLTGGWSRHSYVASAATDRYIVRVKPPGPLLDTDLELEYAVYAALQDTPVPTPRVYGLRADPDTAFGGPFFVMEHVPGAAPSIYAKDDQARLAADFDGPRRVATDMAEALAAIHGLDVATLPTSVPRQRYADAVARWRAVYEERRLVRDPVIEEALAWLDERAPADERLGLVHGDFRIGNALIADGRLTAVLDWELVHLGDVRTDLGYLVLERNAGKHLRRRVPLMGTFADRGWFLEHYAQLTGRPVTLEELAPFQMLGLMMLTATQISAVWMHAHGRTDDFRMVWARNSFPGLRDDMVEVMGW